MTSVGFTLFGQLKSAVEYGNTILSFTIRHISTGKFSAESNEKENLLGSSLSTDSIILEKEGDHESRETSQLSNDLKHIKSADGSLSISTSEQNKREESGIKVNSKKEDGNASSCVVSIFGEKGYEEGAHSSTIQSIKKTDIGINFQQEHSFSPAQQPKRSPIKVLLITYYRGGSTFFGQLFDET